jgi:peroxiredoxin
MLASRATLVRSAITLRLFGLGLVACGSPQSSSDTPKPLPTVTTSAADDAKRIDFAFTDLNGKQVTTESVHGRVTIVLFMTTYDTASQLEARFVQEIAKEHTPRLNAIGLVLEVADNKPMADAFASALNLPFPLCMADDATIRGEGPFTGLGNVPSIVILDKEGRERYRHIGLVLKHDLEDAIHVVEK